MGYQKDFDAWNKEKKQLQDASQTLFFHEREVWWCKLGVNIGFEQDGTNSQFARPVVILKTYDTNAVLGTNAALVVPLTTRDKTGIYYFDIGQIDGRDAKGILSQVRFIDKRRLINKVDVVREEVFEKLRSAIIAINLT